MVFVDVLQAERHTVVNVLDKKGQNTNAHFSLLRR